MILLSVKSYILYYFWLEFVVSNMSLPIVVMKNGPDCQAEGHMLPLRPLVQIEYPRPWS